VRVALDTNILAYAEGTNGQAERDRAAAVVSRLYASDVVIPVQVLGELHNVLVRKAGRSRAQARDAVLAWHTTFASVETSSAVMLAAMDLAGAHRLALWDSVVIAAAASAECRLLLSEDLQDGFVWGGVTIINPMAKTPNPLLASALRPE
jgi:predicted nucleic acid-binding protein